MRPFTDFCKWAYSFPIGEAIGEMTEKTKGKKVPARAAGGYASALAMTPQQRRHRARQGGRAFWKKFFELKAAAEASRKTQEIAGN